MKAIFLIAVICLAAFASASSELEVHALWNNWKNVHNKVYSSTEEDVARFEIFVENFFKVAQWNAAADEDGARLALNKFADLSKAEFKAMMTGSAFVETDQEFIRANTVEPENVGVLPLSVDWVKKGAVTGVKNQEQCGSCWTFSTTGVLEGFNFISTGTLLSFSEQQIVDCDTNDGNQGCNGGWPYLAIQYATENGLELESDYPYEGTDGTCNFDSSKATQISGAYAFVTVNSTNALKTAIVSGPVSVLIEADQDVFQMYSSGVIKSGCGATIDHAVLAVGYGIQGTTEAFTVKNSWDVTWGVQGYVYISTDEKQNGGQGVCGILYQPVQVNAA